MNGEEHIGVLMKILCSKVIWFANRFGVKELFMKPLRQALAPRLIPKYAGRTFSFTGHIYNYHIHPYNTTWANERCVEVPIMWKYVCDNLNKRVLEIGNVLPHYYKTNHHVLDKIEGPIKCDLLEYDGQYDLIVSISTFEHIGFDFDEQKDPTKISQAIQHSRRMLSVGGSLVITIPIGYNPIADRIAIEHQARYLERVSFSSWEETDKPSKLKYGKPHPYANTVAIIKLCPS